MALGIEKTGIFTTYSIPFFFGGDDRWEDNTWLVQHLRQLADKIEEKNPHIAGIGINQPIGYGLKLEIRVFDDEELSNTKSSQIP